MTQNLPSHNRANHPTATLLLIGSIAGPLYIALGIGQMMMRDGFDMRRHALSQLANGDWGFVQIGNFLICGALVFVGAIGVRQATRPGANSFWTALTLGIYGMGLIGAGIFAADPGRGFPPGAPEKAAISQNGLMHFVCGGLGFYGVTAACFLFAWRFLRQENHLLAIASALTGVLFFASFVAIASGPPSETTMLCFYGGVALIWLWHSAVHLVLYRKRVTTSRE